MALLARGHDAPRRALDALSVGDGRAAELHHHGSGHDGQFRSGSGTLTNATWNSRPIQGLSLHLDEWTTCRYARRGARCSVGGTQAGVASVNCSTRWISVAALVALAAAAGGGTAYGQATGTTDVTTAPVIV